MKMSNYIEPSSISAEAKSSLVDGEVLGQDADGGLIQWNATAGAPYNSGQSVEEFGVSNLSEAETKRLNLPETQNTDRRPIAGDPRLFIEKLGYAIDTDCDQPGLWIWTAPRDGCDSSFHTAIEALDGAWNDALAQTLAISEISCEEWGQMDFDQQRVAITFALSGELPSLSDLSPDTQMEWVARVREVYPDIGSKEAFRNVELH